MSEPSKKSERLTERLNMVLSPEQVARVENWRRQYSKIPSFSEAIRQLIDLGLEAAGSDDAKASYDPGPARQKEKA
jgi:hypothetical protein